MPERGPSRVGVAIGSVGRAPLGGVRLGGGERSLSAVSTLPRPVGSLRTGSLELRTVIPQRKPGGILNNLGEFKPSSTPARREGLVTVAELRNSRPFGVPPASREGLSISRTSAATLAGEIPTVGNSLRNSFQVPFGTELSADTQRIMAPQQGRELMRRPYSARPESTNNSARPDIDRSVRIVDLPRRRVGNPGPESEPAPINPARQAPIVEGRLPVATDAVAVLKSNAERRAEVRRLLMVEQDRSETVSSQNVPIGNTSQNAEVANHQLTVSTVEAVLAQAASVPETTAQTSGARYNHLLRRRALEVLRTRLAKTNKFKLDAADTSTSTAKQLRGKIVDERKGKILQRIGYSERARATWGGRSGGFDLTALLELRKKRSQKILRVPTTVIQDQISQPETSIARPGLQVDIQFATKIKSDTKLQVVPQLRRSTDLGAQPLSQSGETTAVASINRNAAAVSAETQSIGPEKSAGRVVDIAVFTKDEKNSGELEISTDESAQKARVYAISQATENAPKDEEENVEGTAVVVGMSKPSDSVISGILKLFGRKVDGSYEALKMYIASFGRGLKKDLMKVALAGIQMFPAVLLGKGKKVGEKELRLVTNGPQAELPQAA